jgi:hypothetical protein
MQLIGGWHWQLVASVVKQQEVMRNSSIRETFSIIKEMKKSSSENVACTQW